MRNRKVLLPIALALTLTILGGCAAKSSSTTTPTGVTAPTALPGGAKDQFDATTFEVVADAGAFLGSIQSSITAGKLTLTASQSKAYNDAVTTYNLAKAAGMAYHNGQASVATVNSATAAMTASLNTAKAQISVP